MPDVNALDLDGEHGLLARLATLPDPRKQRGIRHQIPPILAVAAVAVVACAKSLVAIGELTAELPQEALARCQARRHPSTGRYAPPSEATIRRVLAKVDTDALDRVLGGWLAEQVRTGRLAADALAVAVDGKTVRGAVQDDGRAIHLFAALAHREGVVLAQNEVDHKTNEITAFRPLLEGLELAGAVVTADAMHAQREHARFLVEEKKADYVFTVKDNPARTRRSDPGPGRRVFSPCPH